MNASGRTLRNGLALVCAALLAVDFLRHASGPLDGWFGFYAAAGALAGVFLVWAARWLRRWLTRREDYYP